MHLSKSSLALALGCLLAPAAAHAQYSLNQPFSEGFSLLRFEPAPAGDRFFGVRDAYVPGNPSSRFRLAVIGNVPVAPLLSRTDNSTGNTADVVKRQFITHLNASLIATRWLMFNADLPWVVSQSGDGASAPSGTTLGDTRLGARFGVLGGENKSISFAPSLDVWLPTGSKENLTGDGRVRVQPMMNVGGRSGFFVWSAGVGIQLRRKYDSGSLEIGNAWTFAGAAGVLLLDDVLQVGIESYGSTLASPVRGSAFDARSTALEALLGARVHASDFVFGAAVGPGLGEAPGSAPRVLFSVAFAPQLKYEAPLYIPPRIADDRDQDGVNDPVDACPDEKGPAREEAARNGCPDVTPIRQDRDDDGIVDGEDACPNERGEASPNKAKHGCPVPADRDGDGIVDNDDACPESKGVPSNDATVRGCPPRGPDLDGDGVADDHDACPKFAGVPSDDPKKNGCPAKVASVEAGPASVSFAGFRGMPDGRSFVTIELTGPIAFEVRKSHGTITYTLKDTQVPIRNNQNPLLTNDFPSSVVSAVLSADKKTKDAYLVLKLRDDFDPKQRLVRRGSGAALEIELPAARPQK